VLKTPLTLRNFNHRKYYKPNLRNRITIIEIKKMGLSEEHSAFGGDSIFIEFSENFYTLNQF
jgi:hypothetical protein